MEKKTIVQWCIKCNVRLLDEKYYDDQNTYTLKEFEEKVPRNIQVPLGNSEVHPGEVINGAWVVGGPDETALTSVAKDLIPKDFAKKFKALKKAQSDLATIEADVKEKIKEMFESITDLETNSVVVDGIKFTYVRSSTRNTFDSKKFQEENPKEYTKYLKQSNVKSSIRVDVEY